MEELTTRNRIDGSSFADSIQGTADSDLIFALEGNDTIDGDAGDDNIVGDPGEDLVFGGLGDDTLIGNTGNDTLEGGAGNDLIFGALPNVIGTPPSNDLLVGGVGDDSLASGAGDSTIVGGEGIDAFQIENEGTGRTIIRDFDPGTEEIFIRNDLSQGIENIDQLFEVNLLQQQSDVLVTDGSTNRPIVLIENVNVENLRLGTDDSFFSGNFVEFGEGFPELGNFDARFVQIEGA